jgi:hypothetical protein
MRRLIMTYAIAGMLSILGAPLVAAEKETPASLLAAVNMSDGVNKSDAEKIAKAYFLRHVGCGVFDHISEANDVWVVEGFFGYASQPIKGFLINKRSGAITSSVGPSYERPQDLLR